MVWLQYTATRSQRAATAGFFLTGVALILAAARLSYTNMEPRQAKAAERRRVLLDFIRRKRGQDHEDPPKP
uniref:HIG1 domain-containing protein n=1 Tax=Oryza brachyantha TaxID=4533 RepID=J3LIN4_ORYBR